MQMKIRLVEMSVDVLKNADCLRGKGILNYSRKEVMKTRNEVMEKRKGHKSFGTLKMLSFRGIEIKATVKGGNETL